MARQNRTFAISTYRTLVKTLKECWRRPVRSTGKQWFSLTNLQPSFILALFAIILATKGTTHADANEITVHVRDLRSPRGGVYVQVYNSAELFPEPEGGIALSAVRANGNSVRVVFGDLAAGTYAVAAYHDENDNGQYDRSIIGLPVEGYAFSNNAPVFLSAPSFEDASFELPATGIEISISMRY